MSAPASGGDHAGRGDRAGGSGAAAPLRIGLVGQVNAGKTSIHETLLRYRDPQAVSPVPGWTREVRRMSLVVEEAGRSEEVAWLLDFPGFQRAEALEVEVTRELGPAGAPPGRPDDAAIDRLCTALAGRGDFRHEELVIRHARECGVLLLVIDSREPPGEGVRAEMRVLRRLCGVAPVVLLNFTAQEGARMEAWQEFLTREGAGAGIPFDAWHLAWSNEAALWRRVRESTPGAAGTIARIERDRSRRRTSAVNAVAMELAELMVDLAAMRRPVRSAEDERERRDAAAELLELARRREAACVEALLSRLGFRRGDVALASVGLSEETQLTNPWSAQEVGRLMPGLLAGVATGAVLGGAAGGAVGFVLDLATMFTSLGAATLLGAKVGGAVGGLVGGTMAAWDKLVDVPRMGERDARLRPEAIDVLCLRQVELVRGLLGRGHAAPAEAPARAGSGRLLQRQDRDRVRDATSQLLSGAPSAAWSTLNGPVDMDDARRVEALRRIRTRLLPLLDDAAEA